MGGRGTSSNEQEIDQQFTVTVTACCMGLKIHIGYVTVLKTYIKILKYF
jgi:hypothetical protein